MNRYRRFREIWKRCGFVRSPRVRAPSAMNARGATRVRVAGDSAARVIGRARRVLRWERRDARERLSERGNELRAEVA